MLTFILTVGGILLYLVLGAIFMFPIRMLTWYTSAIFNGIKIVNRDSDTVYIICVLFWPVVFTCVLFGAAYERIRYGK